MLCGILFYLQLLTVNVYFRIIYFKILVKYGKQTENIIPKRVRVRASYVSSQRYVFSPRTVKYWSVNQLILNSLDKNGAV